MAWQAEGRHPEPTAAVADPQAVRSTGVGGPARGDDPAERVAGRKRHLLVDASGPVPSRSRRLARDDERLPKSGEAMIHPAMARITLRRVTA